MNHIMNYKDQYYINITLYRLSQSAGLEEIKSLVKRGADVNFINEHYRTPLMVACHHRREEIVDFYIGNGACVGRVDIFGSTPLHYASVSGSTKIVKTLIDEGANIHARSYGDKCTALTDAASRGHTKVVKLLVAKGADINARNTNGATPLISASRRPCMETVEFLIKEGADISLLDSRGKTFFNYLTGNQKKEISLLMKELEWNKRMIKPCEK